MKLNLKPLLIALIIWVPVVGLLFALIPDKKTASVAAGVGFIVLPLVVLIAEYKKSSRDTLVIVAASVFFFFSALPIFLLRAFNWERDFKELTLFGIPAELLHRVSTWLYFLMVIAVGIAAYRERKLKAYQK